MAKFVIISLLVLSSYFWISCNTKKNSTVASKQIEYLTYSAYRWRIKKDTFVWELYVDHFITIDKDGKYIAIRNVPTSEFELNFTGIIDDSMKCLIKSVLSKKWDSSYYNPEPKLYDGNNYDLAYCINGNRRRVFFIQDGSPKDLQNLSIRLDYLIFNSNSEPNAFFCLDGYKEGLKKWSLSIIGELPKLGQIKFKSVK